MSVKINKLEIENVKRIKAVKLEPTENGLTIIGGDNKQGKTSVLDSIAWALGGDNFRPSVAKREGSIIPPNLKVVLSNGLVVERKGKNSTLKVTDLSGQKAGQTLLNEFVETLALNLPKFMNASNREKCNTLLQILGIGDQLAELELKEKDTYNQRRAIGQIADQKEKFAKEQVYYPEAPKELVSPSDLIKEQQAILARNGENQRIRDHADQVERKVSELEQRLSVLHGQAAEIERKLKETIDLYNKACEEKEVAFADASVLQDESTAELEASIRNIEEINRKVRANMDKDKAEDDAREYREQYQDLTAELDSIRKAKTDLLTGADLPLPELSVLDGELTYQGQKWDNMSGSDQLRVATAIVRKLNPKCGFVLLDKLEQMDLTTLKEFGSWLEAEGLQAIATRVSRGDECSIIIEDGYAGIEAPVEETARTKKWKAGEF